MRTVVSSGNESLVSYGFPLPWQAASQAGTMAQDLALLPLLLDLACYIGGCQIMLAPWAMNLARRRRLRRLIPALLWLSAIGSAITLALRVLSDPQWVWWSLDDYFNAQAVRSRSLHWGLTD